MSDARDRRAPALSIAVLGIVYGDIGTSPLYAMRESFTAHDLAVTHDNILGVLSLIVWSLTIVITVKYAAFVLRADNDGEGGILALASLITPMDEPDSQRSRLVLLGLFGTALLYGDGMITPSISVLSAIEGLEIAAPSLENAVVPISIVILVVLFAVQRHGTARVGSVFGPVMLVWFGVLALLGVREITAEAAVLGAFDPRHAVSFFLDHPTRSFLTLGSVFLVVTGAEALYADLGHFGRRPIIGGWLTIVFPALTLNYLGQGALLLRQPGAIENPFYEMAPSWGVYPAVVLATAATVIASQALISGAFSLTAQALNLDYLPRMSVVHTSDEAEGQIYVPAVNWALMIACILLVLGFRSSSALAAAYGVAVTTTMVITSLLFFVVLRRLWRWSAPAAVALTAGFLVVDVAFFAANIIKIPDGGWFPLVIGTAVFTVMTTWRTGRRLVAARMRQGLPLVEFVDGLDDEELIRVPGTAVYLSKQPDIVPASLLTTLRHHRSLHEKVAICTVMTRRVPRVLPARRARVTPLGKGFFQVVLWYGYAETPDVPAALDAIVSSELRFDPTDTTYVVGRETVTSTERPGMARWRERLFAFMARNAAPAERFFHLPADRTSQIGQTIDI